MSRGTRAAAFAGALVGLLLLAAAPATGGEPERPRLEGRHLDLLPLNQLERQELARDHPEVATRLHLLKQRADRLRGLLAGRANKADDGARRIREQIAQTEAELTPVLAQLLDVAREHHVDDALLRHLATAPNGPFRTARYAQSLVLFVEDLPPAPRQLFERLLPRVEGALLAIAAQRERAEQVLAQAGAEPPAIRAAKAALDRQAREIDRRFWRLVDYVVPEAQRAAIHRVLPTAYQQHENVIQHVFALPGITGSQGVRLRALLKEVEAESSPENALLRTLRPKLKEEGHTKAESIAWSQEVQEAGQRLLELQRYAVVQAKEILTDAQWLALEAIPPRVSPSDRKQHSGRVLEGVELTAEQRERLEAMRRELEAVRREFQEKRIAAAARGAAYGPDSPQMMDMMMAMARVEAEGNVLQRRFNGRLFLELLTPDQVTGWVLGLYAGTR